MAVQTQSEEKRINPFEEEETSGSPKKSRKASMKKPGKPLHPGRVVAGIFACALALFAGRWLRYDTTLFMEHRTLNGYLPVEEYMLNYSDTGEPVQNVRSFRLNRYGVYDYNSGYETSRGIETGDSWEEFVEAYGDVTINSVYTPYFKDDGMIDWDQETEYYYDKTMTVREFDEQHVRNGTFDPARQGIDLEFEVETDGVKVLYSEDEKNNYIHNYLSSHPFGFYPRTRNIYLEFTFTPECSSGRPGITLESIYQSSYK